MQNTKERLRASRYASLLALMVAAVVALCAFAGVAYADDEDSDDATTTYSVVANLSCATPMSITAYLTNENSPLTTGSAPTSPVTEANATLTDNGDGTYTLVLELPNPAFTLQSIEDGDTATILSCETTTEVANSSSTSLESRIGVVTFLLTEEADSYTMEGTLYATPIATEFTATLTLEIDWDSLVEVTDEEEADSDETDSDDAESTSGYTVSFVQSDGETASMMANYIANTAVVANEDGTYTISFNFTETGASLITTVAYDDAELEAGADGYYNITVDSIDELIPVSMYVSAMSTTATAYISVSATSSDDEATEEEDAESDDDEAADYNIVANLSCDAEYMPSGMTAYLTNENSPLTTGSAPTTAATEANATLTDNGEGTYTLVLSIVNPAFTLQDIVSGDTATVVSYETTTEVANTSSTSIETRICEVTFLLTEKADSYELTGTLYATPLAKEFTAPLVLTVEWDDDEEATDEEDATDDESSDEDATGDEEDESTDEDATDDESSDGEADGTTAAGGFSQTGDAATTVALAVTLCAAAALIVACLARRRQSVR